MGSRTDTFHSARRQHRLEQVRCVHCTTRSRAGTDDRVNLVNKQNSAWSVL